MVDNQKNKKSINWWNKIPNSKDYGTTRHTQPIEGNHIKRKAYDDRKDKKED